MRTHPRRPSGPLFAPQRALITGGLGLVGAAAAAALLDALPALQLTLLDPHPGEAGPPGLAALCGHPRVQRLRGAVAEPAALAAALEARPEAIVHAEAFDAPAGGGPAAVATALAQLSAGQALLEAARAAGDPRVLLLSPASVFGPGGDIAPMAPGAARLAPADAQAIGAAALDHLGALAHRREGQPVIRLRLDAAFGPGQRRDAPVSRWIMRAWAREPLRVGSGARGWLHRDELGAALALALQAGAPGEVLQLAAAERRADNYVAGAILDILGRPRALLTADDGAGPPSAASLASEPPAGLDGWPLSRRFDDALAETVEWFVEHRACWAALP